MLVSIARNGIKKADVLCRHDAGIMTKCKYFALGKINSKSNTRPGYELVLGRLNVRKNSPNRDCPAGTVTGLYSCERRMEIVSAATCLARPPEFLSMRRTMAKGDAVLKRGTAPQVLAVSLPAGSSMKNEAPLPSVLSAQMRPPWS